MTEKRIPLRGPDAQDLTRRRFLCRSGQVALGSLILGGCSWTKLSSSAMIEPYTPSGPASDCVPKVKAAFVRRKGEYGMRWPGQIYDGKAAKAMYAEQLSETAKQLGMDLEIRPEAIHGNNEAEAWLSQAKEENADGLMVVLLDRQEHAWPTADKASKTGIPTIIFSPLGSSFTTNTSRLAERKGCVIYSTNDFSQPAYGLKMIQARTKMHRTRCVVLRGDQRREGPLSDTGISLQYVPAKSFLDEYEKMPISEEMNALADEYIQNARLMRSTTREDVIHGVKSYRVARKILEAENADAITMDCLGALGHTKVSLPCIAWSRMNDEGIPAACEADLGAVTSHILVQYLFDRPGFQQDPVADTSDDTIIGAHCCCATKLKGYAEPAEPYDLVPHHGNRDAVPRTLWAIGQRMTSVDVLPSNMKPGSQTKLLISEGTVVQNMEVPPSGGCVVSVKIKFDGDQDVLTFPGFHHLFFYGEFKAKLVEFSQLSGWEAQVV